MRASELLARQMTGAFDELSATLSGLSDDEFSWSPIADAWTVYRSDDGSWSYDYEEPDPVPAPFTTIGWRLVHLALCKVIYHEWAFGERAVDFTTIENPHDVASCVRMLDEGQAFLDRDLVAFGDDLDREVLTNWGEPWPAWRIFTTMIDHDRHHGAEIGVLRDLFRGTVSGRSADPG